MRAGPFLSPQALNTLAGRVEQRVFRSLAAVLERVRAGLPLLDIERALLAQNVDAAVEAIGLEPVINALHEVHRTVAEVRDQSWFSTLHGLPGSVQRTPMVGLSLDAAAADSPYRLQAIQALNLRRIQDIKTETETAIREAIARGQAAGSTPRDVAKNLRAVVGLNRRQASAIDAYRAQLLADGVDPSTVEVRVARKGAQLLKQRAENIATNEVMTALNDGARLQRERLVADGTIDGGDWEQEWVTAVDERVCPICTPLNGVRYPVGGRIDTSEGAFLGPPLHPRCRCVSRLVLKGFRSGEAPSALREAILAAFGGSS